MSRESLVVSHESREEASSLKTNDSRLTTPFRFDYIRLPNRRYRFDSELLHADAETIVLRHEIQPSKPFVFQGEEVIGPGYSAVWFLFQGEPYDIGRFYRSDGTFTGYYVDILEPVHWTVEPELALEPLVDLFLDLWIAPSGEHAVLDEGEFEAAAQGRVLTPVQVDHARAALADLVAALADGTFPPDQVTSEMRAPS